MRRELESISEGDEYGSKMDLYLLNSLVNVTHQAGKWLY